jgi:hypothetical protein
VVNVFSFGFLETYDVAIAFIDHLSYIIPSVWELIPLIF